MHIDTVTGPPNVGEPNGQPRVSIVIVSYNDRPFLAKLIGSLRSQTYTNLQIIVVDNADNTSVRKFTEEVGVKYVHNSNTGYAGGNDIGVGIADGDLMLILNPDTWLEKDAIEQMVRFFQSVNSKCMIVAPKIMMKDSPRINSIGMRHFRRWANLYVNIGQNEADAGQYDLPAMVEAFDGPAFMFRKQILTKTYLFDPVYFYGAETTDLAERVRNLGYEIWACPKAVVHHEMHGSHDEGSLDVRPLTIRNILAHTSCNRGLSALVLTLLAISLSCARYIANGHSKVAKYYLQGSWRFVKEFGVLMFSAKRMARSISQGRGS